MPLAGKMKLNNFLIIAGGTGILLFTGMAIGGKALWDRLPDPPPEPEPVVAAPLPAPEEPVPAMPVPASEPEPVVLKWTPESPAQEVIFTAFAEDLGTNKKKDVTSTQAFKVNLYQDEGHPTANRAKVDLDRDDKWDEKYTLKDDGTVDVQVSPNDDEDYSESKTVEQSAAPAPEPTVEEAPAPSVADGAAAKRPADEVVLSYVGKDLGTNKRKDVTKGKPFKVNVYQDEGNSSANRAKIDLDRDDKWDEKITFGDHVSRKVSPNDDEDYTERYVWDPDAGWVKE